MTPLTMPLLLVSSQATLFIALYIPVQCAAVENLSPFLPDDILLTYIFLRSSNMSCRTIIECLVHDLQSGVSYCNNKF